MPVETASLLTAETTNPAEIKISPELQDLAYDTAALTGLLDQKIKHRQPFTSAEQAYDPRINDLLAKLDGILQRQFKIEFDPDLEKGGFKNAGIDLSFHFHEPSADQAADAHLLAAFKLIRKGLGTYSLKATDQARPETDREKLARLVQFTQTFDQATDRFRDFQGLTYPELRQSYFQKNQALHPEVKDSAQEWKSVSELWTEGLGQVLVQLQTELEQDSSQLDHNRKAQYLF